MIKKITKVITNSTMLGFLIAVLLLPISFMGIASYEEKPIVLSAQDSRETEKDTIKDLQEEDVPEEIEEVIMRLEREYYQNGNL